MLIFFTLLIIFLIFASGFTDSSGAVAGCISTRTLSPMAAVMLAAGANLCGTVTMAYIGSGVAETVSGIVKFGEDGDSALKILSAGMCAVVLWSLATWKFGIPTSVTHSLVAGITGAAIAGRMGLAAINTAEWSLVLMGLLLSTFPSFIAAKIIYTVILAFFENFERRKVLGIFRRSQIWSTASNAFIHGAQDSQKFMGVFMLGLSLATEYSPDGEFSLPFSVIAACALCTVCGTLAGGGKIIKKMGLDMAKFDSSGACAADWASSGVLAVCSFFGIPASTNHSKTCALIGIGSHKHGGGTDKKVIKEMLSAWILTFPACGALGFAFATFILFFV